MYGNYDAGGSGSGASRDPAEARDDAAQAAEARFDQLIATDQRIEPRDGCRTRTARR